MRGNGPPAWVGEDGEDDATRSESPSSKFVLTEDAPYSLAGKRDGGRRILDDEFLLTDDRKRLSGGSLRSLSEGGTPRRLTSRDYKMSSTSWWRRQGARGKIHAGPPIRTQVKVQGEGRGSQRGTEP